MSSTPPLSASPSEEPGEGSDDASPAHIPIVDSRRLLQGRRELLIRHGNEVYRLRHTRNDKLILTK